MKRDNSSYRSIAARYDEYREIIKNRPVVKPPKHERALPPQRPYSPPVQEGVEVSKNVFALIGFALAALLLVLAAWAAAVAAKWFGLDRAGAGVAYTLVAFFAGLSGIGGILATWNHNFRVLAGTNGAHGH